MTSTSRPDLSIVIPAYREAKRIGKTLDELATYIKTDKTFKDKQIEVLVVSADAPDKTHEIVEAKRKKFSNLSLLRPGPKVGKGRDVQFGMLRAKGRTVVFMDADLATPLRHLPKFYKASTQGADVIIGTRNLRKHHPNFLRRLVSNGGNLIFRFAGGVWVEDSQCGFKMFSHEAAQLCFSRLTIMGWGFDMEVLAIARTNELKIVSYRIEDWTSIPEGTFAESVIKNSLVSLKELAYILVKRLSGAYKA
jgi:dolichyl-phosphate beta-glucosyltransferase